MDLEEHLAERHADYFLREFTYSSGRFRGSDGQEREFCDGAVWIGDILILVQLKERNPDEASSDPDVEAKWFAKKVAKKGVDQLHDSVTYLSRESTLPLVNRRAQLLDISHANPRVIHKLVVYRSADALPLECIYKKGRQSGRIGFVHFFHADDYVAVCWTLHTPREISDYLAYRAEAAIQSPRANALPEKALLGNYLSDVGLPNLCHADELYVDRLVDDRAKFSIGNLLRSFLERTVSGNSGTEYHAILAELAGLPRSILGLFRQRLLWAMEKCSSLQPPIPSRFSYPDADSSFIFIPLAASERDKQLNAALNYTTLSKYAFKTTRAVGAAVAPEPNSDAYRIQWCFIDHPWEHDANLEAFLADGSTFREITPTSIGKYNFLGG